MLLSFRLLIVLIIPFALWSATPCQAQDSGVSGQAELQLGGDNLDGVTGAALVRLVTEGGHRLGVRLAGAWFRERFIAGYATDEGGLFEASLQGSWLVSSSGPARYRIGTDVGTRIVQSNTETVEGQRSVALTTDLISRVEVDLLHNLTLGAAVRVGVDFALDPTVELDMLEQPMELGLNWWITRELAFTSNVFVGGAFGYDGDGAKYRLGGTVGLAYAWDGRPEPSQDLLEEEGERSSIGAFVGLEWRMLNLGQHISHGPGFSTGVSFFNGYLKVGIAGFSRPGPLNPATFDVTATDGQTYKGQSTLNLRSDGSVVGAMIAGTLPVHDWITLELPVTVGQAAFGFYLTGEERNTPDGRRVSAWENELQDGRDSSFAIGIDAGLRMILTPPSLPWLRPVVGVHYTLTPGYDAYAKDDYSGLSFVLGTELAVF